MNTPELLTCQEVLHLTGIRSRTTIWRRIQPDTSGWALIDEAVVIVPIEKCRIRIEPDR